MVGAFNRLPRHDDTQTQRQLIVAIAHTALLLFLALAAILMIRRVLGGFHLPLGVTAIALVAAALELAAFCIRNLFRSPVLRDSPLSTKYTVLSAQYLIPGTMRAQTSSSTPAQLRLSPVDFLTTTAVLASAIAVSIPGTLPGGLFIAWLIVACGEIAQRLPQFDFPFTFLPSKPLLQEQPQLPTASDELIQPEILHGLVQQLTRVVEDGRESIHALVNAEVTAHDRLAVIHVAVCPPLAERPELSAHALDCDEAEIRLTQVEPFGARLEVRLPFVSDAARSVVVEILGSSKASQGS